MHEICVHVLSQHMYIYIYIYIHIRTHREREAMPTNIENLVQQTFLPIHATFLPTLLPCRSCHKDLHGLYKLRLVLDIFHGFTYLYSYIAISRRSTCMILSHIATILTMLLEHVHTYFKEFMNLNMFSEISWQFYAVWFAGFLYV